MKTILLFFLIFSNINSQDLNLKKIYLFGEITEESSKEIVSEIMSCKTDILLVINSSGGDVDSGNSIINAINWCDKNVYTLGNGAVYSMAFQIFLYGKKRFSMPNTIFMFHDIKYDVSDYQNLNDLEDFIKFEKKQKRKLNIDIYRKTKIPKKTVEKIIKEKKDLYINNEQALIYNIIEGIVDSKQNLSSRLGKN
jgi:ATP-dependent protease ClpP protease subunit